MYLIFDLAINTILDLKTLKVVAYPSTRLELPHTQFPRGLCDLLLLWDFCSLVYLGGLSRDLDVISVEIKDLSASCHQEIKVVDFSGQIPILRFLRLTEEQGFRFEILSIDSRSFTDQEVREFVKKICSRYCC
ncbi:hypothetical protein GQ457_03G017340 [Hibiscus cannabinus]